MKKFAKFFLICGLVIVASCESMTSRQTENSSFDKKIKNENMLQASGEPGIKKRVLVLPFLDSYSERSLSIRAKAQRYFISEINRKKDFIAIDSQELGPDKSFKIEEGQYDLKKIATQAKDLGVSALLEGKLIDLRVKRSASQVGIVRPVSTTFEIVARVRIASARSGQEIFNTIKTVTFERGDIRVAEKTDRDRFFEENPELLEGLVQETFLDFTPQVTAALGKVTWEGRIAAINGDRIYLNVGQISGVVIGDLLRVTEAGDEIYDPEAGTFIGRVPGRVKGTLEVISYFGQDGSIAIIHSGGGFRESDRVEVYR